MMTIASQGRLMFSALTALSVLMAMGLSAIFPHKLRAIGPAILSSTLLVVAVLTPFVIIAPAYARPPILDEQNLPPMILNADFGGKMVLLGYHLQSDTAAPGDPVPVTLYWRALAPMEQDYSVFVHLVGENDLIVGQRDMYPGQGTFPTSLMQPGDIIADTYVPRIAPTVMTPNLLEVRAGLYQLDTGKRLICSRTDQTTQSGLARLRCRNTGRMVSPTPWLSIWKTESC